MIRPVAVNRAPRLLFTDPYVAPHVHHRSAWAPLGQKIFDSVKEGSFATVAYNFTKPGGTEPVPKEAYVTKVGAQGCGVGYYK